MAIKKSTDSRRGGAFAPLLALLLALITVFGIFSAANAEKSLIRAMKKTEKRWEKREELLLFVTDALFREGTLSIKQDKASATYSIGEEGWLLSQKGSEENFVLQGNRQQNTLFYSPESLAAVYAGDWDEAAERLSATALSDRDLAEEEWAALKTAVSLTEPGLYDALSLVEKRMTDLWQKSNPEVRKERDSRKLGKDTQKGERYTVTWDSKAMTKLLKALAKYGKREEEQALAAALYDAFLCLADGKINEKDKNALLQFLRGEGEAYKEMLLLAQEDKASGKADFFVVKGEILRFEFSFSLQDTTLQGEWEWGKSIQDTTENTLHLSFEQKDKGTLSLTLTDTLIENSDSALVREAAWSLRDSQGSYFKKGDTEGKIRFSYGKEKGDLGLCLEKEQEELVFRGTLKDYQKGKSVKVLLNQVEKNKEPVTSGEYDLLLTTKAPKLDKMKKTMELYYKTEETEKKTAS